MCGNFLPSFARMPQVSPLTTLFPHSSFGTSSLVHGLRPGTMCVTSYPTFQNLVSFRLFSQVARPPFAPLLWPKWWVLCLFSGRCSLRNCFPLPSVHQILGAEKTSGKLVLPHFVFRFLGSFAGAFWPKSGNSGQAWHRHSIERGKGAHLPFSPKMEEPRQRAATCARQPFQH